VSAQHEGKGTENGGEMIGGGFSGNNAQSKNGPKKSTSVADSKKKWMRRI